ncbi:MAG: GTPase ObgE [Planctomycetota bacterium]
MFVDRVEIELFAGRGGDGCSSMRREKYVPRGGPDGGDGGRGADIILQTRVGTNSLAGFAGKRFYRAEKGQPGMGALRHGRNGRELRLFVPCGTSVIDASDGFVIKDLTEPDDSFVVAQGGRGGHGNARFKSSTNQTPRQRQLGADGEVRHVILELKSIADVGLVGMPNAGKSTLLSRISSARPEIADYPFTTKHPNLGIVDVDADRSFVLADIPGLIEGASEGVGLGHEFLRHVERAGVLIHLVEPTPMDGTDPVENYDAIRNELNSYDDQLSSREQLVVMTKCELDPDGSVLSRLRDHLDRSTAKATEMAPTDKVPSDTPRRRPPHLMAISAATDVGLQDLKEEVVRRVMAQRQQLRPTSDDDVRTGHATDQSDSGRPRRVPPHRAAATAQLSNGHQARDVTRDETP